jgi:hypothetical protein
MDDEAKLGLQRLAGVALLDGRCEEYTDEEEEFDAAAKTCAISIERL